MDYKKIFKSRGVRITILKMLSFIPDEVMIKLQYKIKTGRKLDLKNPLRYTEKLQWYKLNYRKELMKKCVNKYLVREYLKEKKLDHLLVKSYGTFDTFDEININLLPNKFVIKDTLGGGGNTVAIIQNKNVINIDELKTKCHQWIKNNYRKSPGREWPYENQKNQLIVEEYIESPDGKLDDFKFFCFGGKVEYIYVITERDLGNSAKLGIFDRNFYKMNVYRKDEKELIESYQKPINFEKMLEYAEILSKPFLHARIDLYNVQGKIYFGEITFFDGSGYMSFEPDHFDFEMGNKFLISRKPNT